MKGVGDMVLMEGLGIELNPSLVKGDGVEWAGGGRSVEIKFGCGEEFILCGRGVGVDGE